MDRELGVFGIPELDAELSAVLPSGWLMLLVSPTGSASQLFAKQFANAGAESMPVLYYTTYERTVEVERVFRDQGWDPAAIKIVNLAEEYYDRVLIRNLEISRARERGLRLADLKAETPENLIPMTFNLSSRILGDLSQIDAPFRLVLDSLDFLLEVLEPSQAIAVARQITYRAQTLGGHALLLVHSGVHAQRTIGLLEDMADLVAEIRSNATPDGFATVLSLQKIRNHPERAKDVAVRLGDHGFALADSET